MKSPWPIISAVLAVVVILLLIFNDPPASNTDVWKAEISRLQNEIKTKEREYDTIAARIKSDSLESIKQKRQYDSTLSVQRSRINDLKRNPIVITVRDSVPEIDSLIVVYDSTIQVQEQRIEVLEHQYNKLAINTQALTINFENRIQLHKDQFAASQQINQAQEKEIKRHKREKKGIIAIGVAAVVGAFLIK